MAREMGWPAIRGAKGRGWALKSTRRVATNDEGCTSRERVAGRRVGCERARRREFTSPGEFLQDLISRARARLRSCASEHTCTDTGGGTAHAVEEGEKGATGYVASENSRGRAATVVVGEFYSEFQRSSRKSPKHMAATSLVAATHDL